MLKAAAPISVLLGLECSSMVKSLAFLERGSGFDPAQQKKKEKDDSKTKEGGQWGADLKLSWYLQSLCQIVKALVRQP